MKSLLRDRALANTQRILVLAALYLADRLCLSDLARVTGIDKGSLEYHLRVLEEKGFVVRKRILTPLGPRLFVEITDRGKNAVRELAKALSSVISMKIELSEYR